MVYQVKDVYDALNDLSGGRCRQSEENSRFFVTKDSGIGKAVRETPGLVWGNPEMEVKKLAVIMTLNESAIELAAATGVNVIIAHHPIADAANSGGVPLKFYLDTYNIAVLECHEAFHGLHPGIPFLHGHKPQFTSVAYGGIPGNIVYVGEVLPEIKTIGEMVDRLNGYMDVETDKQMLAMERSVCGCEDIQETGVVAQCNILLGDRDRPIRRVIHMFPHTGFNAKHLEQLKTEYPDVDTVLATISRVYPGHELIAKAEELGMNFVCGNSHALEISENGMPLAYALGQHLPEAEIVIFRERVTSTPVHEFGSPQIREYAENIATDYLRGSLPVKERGAMLGSKTNHDEAVDATARYRHKIFDTIGENTYGPRTGMHRRNPQFRKVL